MFVEISSAIKCFFYDNLISGESPEIKATNFLEIWKFRAWRFVCVQPVQMVEIKESLLALRF